MENHNPLPPKEGFNRYFIASGPVSIPPAWQTVSSLLLYLEGNTHRSFGRDVSIITFSEIYENSMSETRGIAPAEDVIYQRGSKSLIVHHAITDSLLTLPEPLLKGTYVKLLRESMQRLVDLADKKKLKWNKEAALDAFDKAVSKFLECNGPMTIAPAGGAVPPPSPAGGSSEPPPWAEKIWATYEFTDLKRVRTGSLAQIRDTIVFVGIGLSPGTPTMFEVFQGTGLHRYVSEVLPEEFLTAPNNAVLLVSNRTAKQILIKGLYDSNPGIAMCAKDIAYAAWCGTGHCGLPPFERWEVLLAMSGFHAQQTTCNILVFGLGTLIDDLQINSQAELDRCLDAVQRMYPPDE